MNSRLNLIVDSTLWEESGFDVSKTAAQIFEQTLEFVHQNEDLDFLGEDKTILVNLSLSNDAEIHKLNYEFRGFDKPTNVLSFANIDDDEFDNYIKVSSEIELGDIMIAFETLKREAAEKDISFQNHFSHLLVHGILHLLGFDHQEDLDADYMEDFEVRILAEFNINNPYQE